MTSKLPKKLTPFDIIRHINEKTDVEFSPSEYVPFVINRGLSFVKDTIFFANIVNRYSSLDKDVQYDFLYNGIPKGKRYGSWVSKKDTDATLSMVADYFCINNKHASAYLELLNDEQLEFIHNKTMRGGKNE